MFGCSKRLVRERVGIRPLVGELRVKVTVPENPLIL
jgi:hypothetical protein